MDQTTSDISTQKFLREWLAFCIRNNRPENLSLQSVEGTAFLQGYQSGMTHAASMVQEQLEKAKDDYTKRFN
jgi:hypothetical protein